MKENSTLKIKVLSYWSTHEYVNSNDDLKNIMKVVAIYLIY